MYIFNFIYIFRLNVGLSTYRKQLITCTVCSQLLNSFFQIKQKTHKYQVQHLLTKSLRAKTYINKKM